MCGLAGIASRTPIEDGAIRPRLKRALERLRPRGPDGEGLWITPHCAMAHTRLAVLDLREVAAQPMRAHGLTIIFNGEIYNFRALRDELQGCGYRFKTDGDTEVLLAGWHAWGKALLPRLHGMFAFAVWDERTRSLTMVRDRIGKKPLLYCASGQTISFASDMIALDRVRTEGAAIDPAAVRLLMTLRFIPEPFSIRPDVQKLLPGHLLTWHDGDWAAERWYDPAAAVPDQGGDVAAACTALRTHFDQAVGARLVADVPLGVFLSGGVDSALVAASMVRQAERVQTFTVGFEHAAGYFEERPAARVVAERLGTRHTEIGVSADDVLQTVDAVFEGLDEPFADSSAVPMYILAREARRHVTVALSGDGADEVFAGYRRYRAEPFARSYRALPSWLREGIIGPGLACLPESKGSRLGERVRRLRRFAAHAGKPAADRQAGFYRLLAEDEAQDLMRQSDGGPTPEALIADARRASGQADPVNAMLMADQALLLPGDMLVKVDRMSMANGLEVRSPFLDHRLVAWANGLPGRCKLDRSGGKRILAECFADRLPASVFKRPKKGFELPIAEWLTGPLRDHARRATDIGRLQAQGLFDAAVIQRWWQELDSRRRDTSELLWGVIAFQAWAERHGGEIRETPGP